MTKLRAWLYLCVFAWLAGACGEDAPEPVARLRVEPATAVLQSGGSAELKAIWQMDAPLDAGGEAKPHVFVHLLDSEGRLLRTFDHPLPFAWQAGEQAEAELRLWLSALDPRLPAGTYPLRIGLYDLTSGRKWALVPGEGMKASAKGLGVLAQVEVSAPASGPTVTFPGGWFPAEMSQDLQALARRWMEKRGEILLADLPGPVEVELSLLLVDLPRSEHSQVFLDAEGEAVTGKQDTPSVTITSPCAPAEQRVEGFGAHRVGIVLQPPPGGRCTLTLTPNFLFIETASFHRRSVQLERLTWKPVTP